jgi:hypothetical protein
MTSDEENTILQFLDSNPKAEYSRREIARRAVKRRVYEENERWADGPLSALVARGLIELNDKGLYKSVRPDWMD